jgi:hypothetical protein
MANKVIITGSSIKGTKIGVFAGQGWDITIDSSIIESLDTAVHLAGAPSVAEKLGIPDVPPECLEKFIDLLKGGTKPADAAEKSGVGAYMKKHAIDLAGLVTNVTSLGISVAATLK